MVRLRKAYVGPFSKTYADKLARSIKVSAMKSPYLSEEDKKNVRVQVRKRKSGKGYDVYSN